MKKEKTTEYQKTSQELSLAWNTTEIVLKR